MILKHKGKFNITGRGDVFIISLKENHLSTKRSDMKLLGTKVIIDDVEYEVRGVEAHAHGDDYLGEDIGLLVKQL